MTIKTVFLTKSDAGGFKVLQHVDGPVPNLGSDTRVLVDKKWYTVMWIEMDIIDPKNVMQNVVVKFLRDFGT